MPSRIRHLVQVLLIFSVLPWNPVVSEPVSPPDGKAVYDFYCYQCHAYAGNAQTLASTFLDPRPRNFTAADPDTLSRERMINSVTGGRTGTAMVSFETVLSTTEIAAVVDYIRSEFMQGDGPESIYHTAANGWESHERYAAAFPFASGEIPLDTDWETLTPSQQQGKRLFMTACISCHDRARVTDEGSVWELRPLSYPRRHYSHTSPPDSVSGASPYAVHDVQPRLEDPTEAEHRGEVLYQQNCAFCHAADGTARNWIGSFLEPHPRDLTNLQFSPAELQRLRTVIQQGLPGTSMPAWKDVLDEEQIGDILAYLRRALSETD